MNTTIRVFCGAAWFFLALAVSGMARAEKDVRYDRLVVFGTSLSDPGNAYALYYPERRLSEPPFPTLDAFLIPDMPYTDLVWHGTGHHFSNGPTWIEQVAFRRGLSRSARAAFDSANLGASNYAVRGARAADQSTPGHPDDHVDLPEQVAKFLADYEQFGRIPSHALYVVEIGVNDVRDALSAGNNAPLIIGRAITSLDATIRQLHDLGARRFVVVNSPDVGLTPALEFIDHLQPGAAAGATYLSNVFNTQLSQALESLKTLQGIQIFELDAFSKLQDIHAHPDQYGLTEVDKSCLAKSEPFICGDPGHHLFWDGIHITHATHRIFAREALSLAFAHKPRHHGHREKDRWGLPSSH